MVVKNPLILINGSGTNLNIAYGNTEPEDRTKLWIRSSINPTKITFKNKIFGTNTFINQYSITPVLINKAGIAKYDNSVYIFGGVNTSYQAINKIYKYNTTTNELTTLSTSLPQNLANITAVTAGTKIYLFGGYNTYSAMTYLYKAIYIFDIQNETLSVSNTTLPYYMHSITAHYYEGEIYLIGGYLATSSSNTANPSKNIYKYTILNDTVTTGIGNIGTANANMESVIINDTIYMLGGTVNPTSVKSYCITTNTTTDLEGIALSVSGTTMADKIGTDIYFISNSVLAKYDTLTQICTNIINLPYRNYNGILFVHKDSMALSIFYGENNNAISRFNITQALNHNELFVLTNYKNNVINILNSDSAILEIGIENVFYGNENNIAENLLAMIYDPVLGDWRDITLTMTMMVD